MKATRDLETLELVTEVSGALAALSQATLGALGRVEQEFGRLRGEVADLKEKNARMAEWLQGDRDLLRDELRRAGIEFK